MAISMTLPFRLLASSRLTLAAALISLLSLSSHSQAQSSQHGFRQEPQFGICDIVIHKTAFLGPHSSPSARRMAFALVIEEARAAYPLSMAHPDAKSSLLRFLEKRQNRIDKSLLKFGAFSIGHRSAKAESYAIRKCADDPDFLSFVSLWYF